MELTSSSETTSTTTTTPTTITAPLEETTRYMRNNPNPNNILRETSASPETTTTTSINMKDKSTSTPTGACDSRKKPQLFHSVSIIVEPVLDDDSSDIPLVLTPSEAPAGSESTMITSSSVSSPVLDYDDFIFENQRKKSQEEDEIVQALMANAKLRKEEFARLLEEHAQLVNEINRAETTLL